MIMVCYLSHQVYKTSVTQQLVLLIHMFSLNSQKYSFSWLFNLSIFFPVDENIFFTPKFFEDLIAFSSNTFIFYVSS